LVRKSINRDNFKLGGAISTKGYSDYPKYHQSGDRYFDRGNVDDVHYHLQHQKIIFSQVNEDKTNAGTLIPTLSPLIPLTKRGNRKILFLSKRRFSYALNKNITIC
jgi:hypothetical protein